ncbi:MAG: DUF624 domain-containing protein [Anaeromicrobium sp.]|jgi:hypothetical protein|uniref:DUF624 domain-containing protein n=1 Tax=Anaeromicrobium sp. TaxID=1929132 RepID=UPI0025E594F9|nr:DUF624 domain-containing protein [Anaeromicrobium sp.]MCT4595346.1 DUF624 domain-containing protein [Anaeromicrobium sp.]
MNLLEIKWFTWGEKLYDLILINTLIIVFSLPIFTIGPAIVSGARLIEEWIKGESYGIVSRYLKHFKNVFLYTLLSTINISIWGILIFSVFNRFFMEWAIVQRAFILFVTIEWVLLTCALFWELCEGEFKSLQTLYSNTFIRAHHGVLQILYGLGILLVAVLLLFLFNWLIPVIISGTIYVIKILSNAYRKGDKNVGGFENSI